MLAIAFGMAIAAPAAAQPLYDDLREDSLPLAGDAERLPHELHRTECSPIGLRVVRDTAELRVIQRFPRCTPDQFPGVGRDLYVHVMMGGDCHARMWAEAFRSESRREYRVVLMKHFGGCRAGKSVEYWLRLPPLPDGWTVAFTTRMFEYGEEWPGPVWPSIP